ncbi:MAG TPA: hypothetical protein VFD70_00530, partial [Anaerolineae bacterium]|nr:hypothetical protein [Anaerolineae bacterium]
MTVEINASVRSTTSTPFQDIRALLLTHADAVWMIVLALIAGVYSLQYNILLQAIPHDTTFHIYAAQQILEGHAIYRDVAIIKAPLADFATAFALIFSRIFGISDTSGARVMSLLVSMAVTSATYLAGRVLFRSHAVGVIAGLVMAGWDFYGLRAVTGPEPKSFLILFSLLTFVCIAQRRWVGAGVCGAFTTLAWQPGLMVAGFAVLGAFVAPWQESKPTTHGEGIERGLMNTLRVVGGFAMPFVLVLAYLAAQDAVLDAWRATIGANLKFFGETQARTTMPQLIRTNIELIQTYSRLYCFSRPENWLIAFGTLGFGGIIATEIVGAARNRRLPLNGERTPFILYGLGFATFTLIDFDFCPDLFPLLPVLAIGTGWLAWTSARVLAGLFARYTNQSNAPRAQIAAIVLIALALVSVYILDVRAYRVRGVNYLDQLAVSEAAKKYL